MKIVFVMVCLCLVYNDLIASEIVVEVEDNHKQQDRQQQSCCKSLLNTLCCRKSKEEEPLAGMSVNVNDDLSLPEGYEALMPYLKLPENRSYHIPKDRRNKHIRKAVKTYQKKQRPGDVDVRSLLVSQSQAPQYRSIGEHLAPHPDVLLQKAADEISQIVVQHDIEFLNHTITQQTAQKIVSATILLGCSIGLAALNGYLGSSC